MQTLLYLTTTTVSHILIQKKRKEINPTNIKGSLQRYFLLLRQKLCRTSRFAAPDFADAHELEQEQKNLWRRTDIIYTTKNYNASRIQRHQEQQRDGANRTLSTHFVSSNRHVRKCFKLHQRRNLFHAWKYSITVPSEWTIDPSVICILLTGAAAASPRRWFHKSPQLLALCPVWEKKDRKVILQTSCIHTSSFSHCSRGIDALHFNGVLSMHHYSSVISHQPTVRYGSGFIAFPWSRVFLGSCMVLSQAAYGDPSLGLTPLINSACRSAEPHAFHWAAVGAASLEVSSDWLSWVLH